jgi:hypothetical protein
VHGGAVRLLRNEGGNARAWLRLVLRSGRSAPRGPHRSTSDATGALVRLTTKGVRQMREVGGQSSYLSQEPPGEVFFGLGGAETVDRLEIRWPSGRTQSFEGLAGRATVRIEEGGPPQVEAARR